VLGTLGDVWANPVMVDALIHAREGTSRAEFSWYEPPLPPIDNTAQLERWEPWVRAYMAVGELLQGISFAPTMPGPGGSPGFQVLSYGSLIAEIQQPAPATFEQQIPLVLSWGELRDERATEIIAQIDPQYAFWSSIVYLHPDRTRRTLELINIVLQLCVYVEMRFKHALGCWRPVEYNAQVQPMLTTPGHGTFPMGHATQCYAVAYVLKALLNLNAVDGAGNKKYPTVTEQLDRQAARISTNRVIAGLHFPVDSMAGRMLGTALGEYFVACCTTVRTFNAASGIDLYPTKDFNPFSAEQDLDSNNSLFYWRAANPTQVAQSPIMAALWGKAHDEWTSVYKFP
jgi:hypothetical protein